MKKLLLLFLIPVMWSCEDPDISPCTLTITGSSSIFEQRLEKWYDRYDATKYAYYDESDYISALGLRGEFQWDIHDLSGNDKPRVQSNVDWIDIVGEPKLDDIDHDYNGYEYLCCISIEIQPNITPRERTGIITVSYGSAVGKFKINQEAADRVVRCANVPYSRNVNTGEYTFYFSEKGMEPRSDGYWHCYPDTQYFRAIVKGLTRDDNNYLVGGLLSSYYANYTFGSSTTDDEGRLPSAFANTYGEGSLYINPELWCLAVKINDQVVVHYNKINRNRI